MPYDTHSSWTMRRPPLVPVLIVSVGTLIAMIFWCLPSLPLFSLAMGNLPTLWQIESNHRVILVLAVRVLSPLFVAAILTTCCWLSQAIVPFLPAARKQARTAEGSGPAQRTGGATVPVARSSGETQPPVQPGSLQDSRRDVAPTPRDASPRPIASGPAPLTQTNRSAVSSPQTPPAKPRQESEPSPVQALHHDAAASSAMAEPIWAEAEKIPRPVSLSQQPLTPSHGTSTLAPQPRSAPPVFIEIALLEDARIAVVAPDGRRSQVMLAPKGVKRISLLAYIGWQRGKLLHRDRMVEAVFGHGLSDEDAVPKRLSDAFDSHRKFLRQNLRDGIAALNSRSGAEVVPANLDLFTLEHKCWTLASHCRVVDLDAVEAEHAIIEAARRDGKLANDVPEDIKAACDRLLAAYSGDFLARLVREHLADLDPWHQSWMRKPYTLYRDMRLQALWYAAEYELHAGHRLAVSSDLNAEAERQREHYERAAHLYYQYAMDAVSHRFDTKVTFGKYGERHGERVAMSERALRRTLLAYGMNGKTKEVQESYDNYVRHMSRLSAKVWTPSKDTLSDLEQAKSRTSAFRFTPGKVTPHELSQDLQSES